MQPDLLIPWFGVLTFVVAMIWAAVQDLVSFRISNVIPIVLVVAFAVTSLALAVEWATWLRHLSAGMVVLLICFGLFMRGYIGGGDAKLLAATAIWTGWSLLPSYLLVVALIGGLMAIILVGFRRLRLSPRIRSVGWISRLHERREHVPYGVAIGCGGLIAMSHLPVVATISAM